MPCKIETVVKERFPNKKAGKVGIFKIWDVKNYHVFSVFRLEGVPWVRGPDWSQFDDDLLRSFELLNSKLK